MNYTGNIVNDLHGDLCQATEHVKCRVVNAVWIGAPLFIIISGTVMNLFCLIVLTRPRLRKYTISIFLLFLACSDCCVLWTTTFRSLLLRLYKVELRNLSLFSCHVTDWLLYTSTIYSSCILVWISVERCLVAKFPSKMRSKINTRGTLIVSVVTLVVVAIVCGHFLLGLEYVERADVSLNTTTPEYVCQSIWKEYDAFLNEQWVGFLFCFNLLCCVAIVACNTCTAFLLRRQAKRVQRAAVFVQATERRRRASFIVLLVVTSYYVIMTFPSTGFLLYLKMTASDSVADDTFATWQLIYLILIVMFWSNYSFNFVLYLMSGRDFREECKRIVGELKKWASGT